MSKIQGVQQAQESPTQVSLESVRIGLQSISPRIKREGIPYHKFPGETSDPHYRNLERDAVNFKRNFYQIIRCLIQRTQEIYNNIVLMRIRNTIVKLEEPLLLNILLAMWK